MEWRKDLGMVGLLGAAVERDPEAGPLRRRGPGTVDALSTAEMIFFCRLDVARAGQAPHPATARSLELSWHRATVIAEELLSSQRILPYHLLVLVLRWRRHWCSELHGGN